MFRKALQTTRQPITTPPALPLRLDHRTLAFSTLLGTTSNWPRGGYSTNDAAQGFSLVYDRCFTLSRGREALLIRWTVQIAGESVVAIERGSQYGPGTVETVNRSLCEGFLAGDDARFYLGMA